MHTEPLEDHFFLTFSAKFLLLNSTYLILPEQMCGIV